MAIKEGEKYDLSWDKKMKNLYDKNILVKQVVKKDLHVMCCK
jgi:hypothetical protein